MCVCSPAAPARDPRFHLVPPRHLDGPRFYASLPVRGRAGAPLVPPRRDRRREPVRGGRGRARAPPAAVAGEARRRGARRLARLDAGCTARVCARALGPVGDRARGLGGAQCRRAPRRLRLHRVARARDRPRAGRRVHDLLRPRCVRRTGGAACRTSRASLFVGVLERYKNVEVLAAAWRLVAARLPEARLHLVGMGTQTGVGRGACA